MLLFYSFHNKCKAQLIVKLTCPIGSLFTSSCLYLWKGKICIVKFSLCSLFSEPISQLFDQSSDPQPLKHNHYRFLLFKHVFAPAAQLCQWMSWFIWTSCNIYFRAWQLILVWRKPHRLLQSWAFFNAWKKIRKPCSLSWTLRETCIRNLNNSLINKAPDNFFCGLWLVWRLSITEQVMKLDSRHWAVCLLYLITKIAFCNANYFTSSSCQRCTATCLVSLPPTLSSAITYSLSPQESLNWLSGCGRGICHKATVHLITDLVSTQHAHI